jgi:uncharacterized membrane protein YhaH (DUF805 family)
VSFTDAIRDGFSKYVTFTGRSSRSAYWWWALFGILAVLAGYIVDALLGTTIIYVLVALALLLPNLAVTIRRLHDIGRSGWWILIALIPFVGSIVLLVFTLLASDGPNQWGAGPDSAPGEASALA